MPTVIGVIPARLGSKRLPDKALLPLAGKPLLFYVWRSAARSARLDRLLIATDSDKIERAAREFGAEVVRTSRRARNGTERAAEVARKVRGDIYVNIQGDNVRFPASWLDRGIAALAGSRAERFHTLATPISSDDELFNPNKVKAALIQERRGLVAGWFSRFPLPYVRDRDARPAWRQARFYKHLGFYFYRRAGLLQFARWTPGPHEKAESLEQLRILERGGRIGVTVVRGKCVTVDSPEDLAGGVAL